MFKKNEGYVEFLNTADGREKHCEEPLDEILQSILRGKNKQEVYIDTALAVGYANGLYMGGKISAYVRDQMIDMYARIGEAQAKELEVRQRITISEKLKRAFGGIK